MGFLCVASRRQRISVSGSLEQAEGRRWMKSWRPELTVLSAGGITFFWWSRMTTALDSKRSFEENKSVFRGVRSMNREGEERWKRWQTHNTISEAPRRQRSAVESNFYQSQSASQRDRHVSREAKGGEGGGAQGHTASPCCAARCFSTTKTTIWLRVSLCEKIEDDAKEQGTKLR